MNKKILTSFIILILLAVGNLYSKPRIEFLTNPKYQYSPKVLQTQTRFDANNIDTWVQNTGIFDQDIRTSNTPGLMWPKGSNKFAIFTAGLSIGTKIDGQLRLASASYKGEYAPGYVQMVGGAPTPVTNSDFKIYKVTSDDSTSSDYVNWYKMVPYGAPYVDKNGNGIFDQGIDRPGIKDATQTIFICMTDGWPENHSSSEGFSGGTQPIFSEMHLTGWAYNEDGINDIQFYSFVVINKNNKAWNNTFFGVVVDPDLGDATDDYIGCDTAINVGYCYNADNMDGTGNSPSYGANPPASGMDFFLSPIIPTGNNNDSVVFYDPPGSDNRQVRRGYRELGMTSFVYFTNTGSGGITCETDPSQPSEAYNYLNGIKKDGVPWFNAGTKQRSKKLFPGDPETGSGWTELGYNGNPNIAVIKNCAGGDTNATFLSPPGDRRFIFNSGSVDLTVNPGDTQRVVLAQMVARGTNNKNAVTRLKRVDIAAQSLFNVNFKKSPDIPLPKSNFSVVEKGAGKCNVILSWDDAAENYLIKDSLIQPAFDNSWWKFEGYEIYQIKDVNQPIPDFYQPETMNDNIKLLKTYDIVDTIGYIIDTISNVVGGNTAIPVCPPYLMSVPEGFPNTGINRSFVVDNTAFPDNQGNESQLILGRTYYFVVVAYAYKTNPKSGYRKIKRNSISINTILTVRPESPLGGSVFPLKNADSVSTNRRDLGVNPVVVNQALVVNAKYKIVFNNKNGLGANDTTYNVLKSVDNGVTYDTLKKFLKYTNNPTQDSSRIIDGILMNVKQIKSYNQGVVKDPGARADSIQSRFKGWDYLRSGAPVNVFKGSQHFAVNPYQSKSMSLSFPLQGTFNNVKSQLRADQLRRVRIDFSDVNSGQFAYRYFDTSKTGDAYFIYRDSVKVPFKVYQVDSLTNETRQLNCAIVVSEDIDPTKTGGFIPTTDSLGNKLLVYVFNSTYDGCATTSYKTKNLFISLTIDVMYVWAPRLNDGQAYANGDQFYIYPYTTTRPFFSGTIPLTYEFETMKAAYSITQAKSDLDKIRIVPNPYYGYNDLETASLNKFVTFRNLPKTCKIKIYTLDGILIRTLDKDNTDSTYPWDLKNIEKIPVASGMYIVLIDVVGIGQKVMKAAIFMPEERVDVR
jgi:hypothetical protein